MDQNYSAYFDEKQGVVFNTTRRKDDGAYQFNHPGPEMVKVPDINDREIGDTLLALLPRCK